MSNQLLRKLSQLRRDTVLRKWLIGRLLLQNNGEPTFLPHLPPYLKNKEFNKPNSETQKSNRPNIGIGISTQPTVLQLPGLDLQVEPGQETELFQKTFDDTETLLGLQRFAWLPTVSSPIDVQWAKILWQIWQNTYSIPDDSWAWHLIRQRNGQ